MSRFVRTAEDLARGPEITGGELQTEISLRPTSDCLCKCIFPEQFVCGDVLCDSLKERKITCTCMSTMFYECIYCCCWSGCLGCCIDIPFPNIQDYDSLCFFFGGICHYCNTAHAVLINPYGAHCCYPGSGASVAWRYNIVCDPMCPCIQYNCIVGQGSDITCICSIASCGCCWLFPSFSSTSENTGGTGGMSISMVINKSTSGYIYCGGLNCGVWDICLCLGLPSGSHGPRHCIVHAQWYCVLNIGVAPFQWTSPGAGGCLLGGLGLKFSYPICPLLSCETGAANYYFLYGKKNYS